MKKLSLLFLVLCQFAFAEIKISQLPLGSAASTTSADVFPWVNIGTLTTEKMTLWDLPNLPPFQNFTLTTMKASGGQVRIYNPSASFYNFQLDTGLIANNVYSITPSTAVGGSTFSIPIIRGYGVDGSVRLSDTSYAGSAVYIDGNISASQAANSIEHDWNGITRLKLANTTNGASSQAQLKITSSTGDVNFFSNSAASGSNNSGITSDSTFTAGFVLTQLGANPVSIRNNGAEKIGISGTGIVNIVGTTTNDSAAAGSVGQYVESLVSGSATTWPVASATIGDLTSISLTAGDWDVTAITDLEANGATTAWYQIGISTTSGNSNTGLVLGSNYLEIDTATSLARTFLNVPAYRMSLASTTTVYLKGQASFSVATPKYNCRLSARRVR